ncbi:MAG: hypothetical protein ACMUIG_05665 [Thermoplasmatota archaeon]
MADNTLEKLLEAEKISQMRIEEARRKAEEIVKRADLDAVKGREENFKAFAERRKAYLEKVRSESGQEAERIKRDGLEIARGLEDKLKNRIPQAVDTIMKEYLNDNSQD